MYSVFSLSNMMYRRTNVVNGAETLLLILSKIIHTLYIHVLYNYCNKFSFYYIYAKLYIHDEGQRLISYINRSVFQKSNTAFKIKLIINQMYKCVRMRPDLSVQKARYLFFNDKNLYFSKDVSKIENGIRF